MDSTPLLEPVTRNGRGATRAPAALVRSERRTRGFTLIEVMITVAVIALLASVALPTYTEYIRRSKLVEATASLSDMRVRLEQYFLDARQYPTACIAPAAGPASSGNIYLPSMSKYFTVTCTLTTTTYTVTATGKSTEGMSGFTYTVDQSNNRKTTSLPSGWSGAGASSTCWIIRKNGSC